MVIQDIKSMKEKHASALRAISKAMRAGWYNAERIAQYGRSRATLDATECHDRASIALYRPSGRHGHQFRHKKSTCGVVKSLFEASVKKEQN
jgi:hypothetical protein